MARSRKRPGRVRIGISGWRYPPWRGVFYPKDLPQRRELEYASRAFPSIEINGTFYSLQSRQSFERWHRETPADFVFSVKGSRYITHILRLREPRGALRRFLGSGLSRLRAKLGPILWQFPPSFRYDAALMDTFFRMLPRKLRHAVEIRHPSFVEPSFYRLLRKHGIALVVADTAGKWPFLMEQTADFMYLRLHGDEELYASGYTGAALATWARRIRTWRRTQDVYCYFDNDKKVKAPVDARNLMRKLRLRWPEPAAS
jgi:uncharacterized protein YecE (DUF72 family)